MMAGSSSITIPWSAPSVRSHQIAKKALFAGSDKRAEYWAIIASLIETAKLNKVEPTGYLSDILTKIVTAIPTARSMSYCLGHTPKTPNSKPWPENIALMSVVNHFDARHRSPNTERRKFCRTQVEAEREGRR
jgi:hypothetical protein